MRLVRGGMTIWVINLRELAVQLRDDLSNGLGCTSGRRDDVVVDGAPTTPVLIGGAINSLLSGGGSMDCAHQTLNDTELVMKDLDDWRQSICRAGCVGDLHVN